MCELWEESDCGMSEGESRRIGSEEDANQRTAKSDRGSGCTYSVKEVRKDLGSNQPYSRG